MIIQPRKEVYRLCLNFFICKMEIILMMIIMIVHFRELRRKTIATNY